jgi:hypothetical protein
MIPRRVKASLAWATTAATSSAPSKPAAISRAPSPSDVAPPKSLAIFLATCLSFAFMSTSLATANQLATAQATKGAAPQDFRGGKVLCQGSAKQLKQSCRPGTLYLFSLETVQRYDSGRLSRAGVTPVGGARVRAHVARTGVQVYTLPGGKIRREYRPAEEVFKADSLLSYVGAPITIGHPRKVDRKSWSKDAAGVITSAPTQVKLADAHDYVETFVDVNRDDALSGVESGELVELSAGYKCDFDPTPGETPSGEKYDGIQRNIRINHVALLPEGKARAGRKAKLVTDQSDDADGLRLDADGNQLIEREEKKQMKFVLLGKEYEAGPELQAAIGALEGTATAAKSKADAAEAAQATAEGKLTLAEKAKTDAEAKVSADAIDKLVADELAFRASAAKVLGDKYDFKGKARRDVKCEIVKATLKKELTKDDSDVRVDALYEVALEAKADGAKPSEDYSKRETSTADSEEVVLDADAWNRKCAGIFGAQPKK